MPIRPQKWHQAFQPNAATQTDGLPNITGLTNGNYVVTWVENFSVGPSLHAQIFDALGNRVGGELSVNTTGDVTPISGGFDVAPQPNGGFVVAWQHSVNNGDIVFQRFSSHGGKLGGETRVAGGADSDTESQPSITTLKNGNFVISWKNDSPGSGESTHVSVYSSSGTLTRTGTDVSILQPAGGVSDQGQLAATADGGFVLVNTLSTATGADIILHHVIEASFGGGPLGLFQFPTVTVNLLQPGGLEKNPAVVGLANGGWAVAYSDEVNSSDHDIFLRVYNSAGNLVSSRAVATTAANEDNPSLAASADGTFLLSWNQLNFSSSSATSTVFGRYFSGTGASIGNTFQMGHPSHDADLFPIVGSLSDGRYGIGWTRLPSTITTTSVDHSTVQILDGRDAKINGTSGADVIAGHDTGQSNLNDIISGLGGNDVLYGLAGHDVLSGGSGNDRLVGGPGRDIMSGGTGNDAFVFGSIKDTGKTTSTRDVINDFQHLHDRIDLKAIDAKSGTTANDAFNLIGAQGFHHTAGELHFEKFNSSGTAHDFTLVEGDLNGDGVADFQIQLKGLINLTKADFVL